MKLVAELRTYNKPFTRGAAVKRNLLIGIIGFASTASVLSQGHITIWNYAVQPYNQVIESTVFGFVPLNDDRAMLQIWFGEGVISDPVQLQPGVSFFVNPTLAYDPGAGHGPGRYFDPQLQVLPDWQPGDTYTFRLQVYQPKPTYETLVGWSALWTEQDQIVSTGETALLASAVPSAIFPIPEPSTFALTGLGIAAAVLLRRRAKR